MPSLKIQKNGKSQKEEKQPIRIAKWTGDPYLEPEDVFKGPKGRELLERTKAFSEALRKAREAKENE